MTQEKERCPGWCTRPPGHTGRHDAARFHSAVEREEYERELQKEGSPPVCDVQGCAEDAVTEVNGNLRLNPGDGPPKWIEVQFNLCAAHEADHDRCHGEPLVSALEKTAVQP